MTEQLQAEIVRLMLTTNANELGAFFQPGTLQIVNFGSSWPDWHVFFEVDLMPVLVAVDGNLGAGILGTVLPQVYRRAEWPDRPDFSYRLVGEAFKQADWLGLCIEPRPRPLADAPIIV